MTEQITDLKSIIKESATIEEQVPGYDGFIVTVCFPGRQALQKIRKAATTQKLDRKTGQVKDEIDDEKFLHSFIQAVIKNWKGLKVSYMQELALVDAEGLDPDAEIAFSVDNAVVLMENSPTFDTWITELSTDFENFTQHR